jgi:protein SCO1/2
MHGSNKNENPAGSNRRLAFATLLMAFSMTVALAQEEHHHGAPSASASVDEHAAHHAMLAAPTTRISRHEYSIPDVALRDQSGAVVPLQDLLAIDRPLALNFVYTTCTTICPVLTALMKQLQGDLAGEAEPPVFVSISIDPTYDSPEVLREYADRFGANWTFLTGSSSDVVRVLQAFDAYRGSKVNHFALTLLRPSGTRNWTRVEGMTSAQDLARIWNDTAH